MCLSNNITLKKSIFTEILIKKMTQQNENFLVKSTMTYGLYVGVAFSFVLFIFHISGQTHIPGDKTGLINTLIISFSMLYFGRKYQQEYYPEGILYKQALGFTILLSVFASIIYSFVSYWYFKFVEPAAIQVFLKQMETMLTETTQMPKEQNEVILQMYSEFLTPGSLAFAVGFNQAFSGLIFSFVVSYFIKSPLNLRSFKQQ